MELLNYEMLLALAITFGFSGFTKLTNLQTSVRIAVSLEILPKKLSTLYGILLPFSELALAILILLKFKLEIVLVLAILLLASFVIGNLKAIISKKDLACNCFGSIFNEKLGWGGILHSLFLIVLSCIALLSHSSIGVTNLFDTLGTVEVITVFFGAVMFFFMGILFKLTDFSQ
ncbi:hypothetical protein FHS18_004048 [Paenibacillus phyllosphaerae]|uniref:Methylamine utilisation protein MauE domain-containing protein n=1 Tax=Paenibacillus phyllosphaerae TaxID=274593 RepID=A0A7W5B053_9BACL|nr:MauE/DoxX family redox-associated membrane protein [Paenibacillus phyllosphaerae]MBB3111980.1 hypothetical protein [Paenibacillus phyllosphaerae]